MKPPMSKNEIEVRSRFDFSKPTRGRFYDRYQKGHTITLLDHNPDASANDDLDSSLNAASTRQAGKRIFVSHVQEAGLKLAEPLRDESIDYLISRNGDRNEKLVSYAVQLKTSANETFSLHKTDVHIPRSFIAYVWNAHVPKESSVYALTFEDALQIIKMKGYAETDSWINKGGYSVTHAGTELREMLEPFRMNAKRWHERLQAV
jgi:hypothetical protein